MVNGISENRAANAPLTTKKVGLVSKYYFVLSLSLFAPVFGQSQPAPDMNLRMVNGQVYHIERSQLWSEKEFEFVARTNGLVIARQFRTEDIKQTRYYPQTGRHVYAGELPDPTFRAEGYRTVVTGQKRIELGMVAITNLTRGDLAAGKEFTLRTMIAGRSAGLELHDCGTLYVPPRATNSDTAILIPTGQKSGTMGNRGEQAGDLKASKP